MRNQMSKSGRHKGVKDREYIHDGTDYDKRK